MVSTRSKDTSDNSATGEKRGPSKEDNGSNKKPKVEKNQKLQVGKDGDVELKKEDPKVKEDNSEYLDEIAGDMPKGGIDGRGGNDEKKGDTEENLPEDEIDAAQEADARTRSGPGQTKQEGDELDTKTRGESPGAELDEPKHGTLESGHIYFLYRPKIDAEQVDSVDDISKFHILLLPKSAPHDRGHYHRTIEVGKKKLPDPGAKRQVIWGLVTAVSTDPSSLKDAFGAYSYETKTKGTRHQPAARPAARGHYILHSPRDELADDPDRNRQRDFKMLLAYEITTPTHEDFGNVQAELGIEERGAVVLQVKDPNVSDNSGNPRAANMPREKKAHFPPQLQDLFRNRRWLPANPPAFLNYQGAEVLILTSPHKLEESLGKDGEKVEDDLDHDAEQEKVSLDGAMKELGMSKGDTEIEALEGHWA